ncbi:DUF4469 domain-containing protein [Riemerella anatipestifer]|uniref:DUF4469 domain-containing protein n=1 Tax=Riemerella anatipestifer TaxID=34085 RepID=UPI0007ECA43C|nr:DUF4469 domain-containing protein [Riemerella anatipestifer]AZZ58019.1 DUF4469 domain-containing protein [Riemerella anatipestifer]MBT0572539.1 DUF4469 domain-containing protein [Riemerella anatipestifer]MDD1539114.1 DUF4469 domain-containing protein [Riemerella anatipestifer]MDR7693719.1 DUF4469 domain-containing protein [Riemerella anatipestifer]MDR7794784.1 DUF4469 domain-containing protein [Riemerella anatipestifer]
MTYKALEKANGILTEGKATFIKIDGDNPKNGIVFKNLDKQNEVKLTKDSIVLNEPSRLLILVPSDLEAGNYELSITTQYAKGGVTTKEPRVGVLSAPVVIG